MKTWESPPRFWYSTHGWITRRMVPMFLFPTATLERGETVVVKPREGLCLDFISFSAFMYSYILLMSFTLFWWCELPCERWYELAQARASTMRSLNPQPVIVGHSALSTDAFSEPWAVVGLAECHHAEVGRNWWMSGRTFAAPSAASEFLLPQLLGNTPSSVHRDDRPAWS
jgi:hypothetical protein